MILKRLGKKVMELRFILIAIKLRFLQHKRVQLRHIMPKCNILFRELQNGKIPEVNVEVINFDKKYNGTKILIKGYQNNRREQFTQAILKDYIIWKTKFGTIEKIFRETLRSFNKLYLKGLDVEEAELLSFGHIFPNESPSVEELFQKYMAQAPDYYCKRFKSLGI